mmetsp:Transcript_51881/g.117025  ORF Transcript_51881/g.117025 Transcript_51881/m.117025 type:complete len:310 (-) Transcript_51881:9-938(-)
MKSSAEKFVPGQFDPGESLSGGVAFSSSSFNSDSGNTMPAAPDLDVPLFSWLPTARQVLMHFFSTCDACISWEQVPTLLMSSRKSPSSFAEPTISAPQASFTDACSIPPTSPKYLSGKSNVDKPNSLICCCNCSTTSRCSDRAVLSDNNASAFRPSGKSSMVSTIIATRSGAGSRLKAIPSTCDVLSSNTRMRFRDSWFDMPRGVDIFASGMANCFSSKDLSNGAAGTGSAHKLSGVTWSSDFQNNGLSFGSSEACSPNGNLGPALGLGLGTTGGAPFPAFFGGISVATSSYTIPHKRHPTVLDNEAST